VWEQAGFMGYRGWPEWIRSAVIHVISLAHFSLTFTRSVAANSINARIRLKVDINRLRQEIALLTEEMRIKDARMERIPAQRRPHYPPVRSIKDECTRRLIIP
jgi:hypothetical protein